MTALPAIAAHPQVAAAHPQVAAALRRVAERRIEYVTQLTELGFSPDEARRRGLLIYTSHLGQTQLVHAAPHVLPTSRGDRKRVLRPE
ncbi:hypothetical protein [Actinoallomurus acaciae]|uniref:Uncharacterized protein n=1 Tax=Actinoallomurus acaciae TaxID=502577 RepID=A0ABV5YU25_9ACTN